MSSCSVPYCSENIYCKGYCSTHYFQMQKLGRIREEGEKYNRRGPKKLNKFDIKNDITEMEVYDSAGNVKHLISFHTKYLNDIKPYRWFPAPDLYVYAHFYDENNIKRRMALHKFIVHLSGREIPLGHQVDHKNGNKLNCLDDNLRVCTPTQNNQNQKGRTGRSSKYKGVHLDKQSKKWRAIINVNYKHINLGSFNTEEEAAKAYNDAAIKLFGEFALLNIIE